MCKTYLFSLITALLVCFSVHVEAKSRIHCDPKLATPQNLECHMMGVDHGYVDSAEFLGDYYFTGEHIDPDYPKAEKYYLIAGEKGVTRAQLRLGFMYAETHFPGVEDNLHKGEYWFKKAADSGKPEGLFRLGNFYNHYIKPPQYKKAEKWLLKAADKGYGSAQYDLALLYETSKLGAPNPAKYLSFMTEAAENGIKQAQIALLYHYEKQGEYQKAMGWALTLARGPGSKKRWLEKMGELSEKMAANAP